MDSRERGIVMPVIDSSRCIINDVVVSVSVYLRVLASDARYVADSEQLLLWAAQYESVGQ